MYVLSSTVCVRLGAKVPCGAALVVFGGCRANAEPEVTTSVGCNVASLLLVVRPGAPSNFLFLVAMPGAPSSVLAPRVPEILI